MAEAVYRRRTLVRTAGAICLSISLFSLPCPCAQGQPAPPPGVDPPWNRHLKILYAGRPDSARGKDFVRFLMQYFDVVRTGNLATFQESDTQGFDVTLLDWDADVNDVMRDFQGPKPVLSESFSRPLITFGVPGSWLCSHWRLKTGFA